MTQCKLTGFRLNNLQRIAEEASQKKVLYLQPEVKKELEMRSTFKILFYANKDKGEGWNCSCHRRYLMTFAKMYAIIRRNAEKAQQAKAYNQPQLTHYELPKKETAPESQKHTESSISIPSPGLFDTNNPVYNPAEEEFRRRMQKKKKKRGPRL